MAPKPDPTPAPPPGQTAIDAVFDALVADIVRGTYPPGSRLPAERDLARMLGASRPTLREALRRLAEWNLVAARRGSGVAVRETREWMIEVLPTFLRHARPAAGHTILDLVRDILLLRRLSMVNMLRMMGSRVPAGGTATAREHVERAWAMRSNTAAFAAEDFQVIRALCEAASSFPAMWMVNRISGVYLDMARSLAGAIPPPSEYVAAYGKVLDHIDKGDAEAAARELDAYLERHDQKLLTLLGHLK
ncbi:MAG TPA: GntR family transcriptional regulator [Kofleriaceae bacterium]|nr:GntR family transcriptional regulator [Kofleriaceae bacterium]